MADGSAVAIQAYLNLNGVVWKLMEDGSLVPLEPGEAVFPDIPLLDFPDSSPAADLASSSSQSSLASFFTTISRDGGIDIPSSGYDTRGVTDTGDSSRDAKQGPPPDLLPNDAGISIQIQDGGDGYVNRFEQDAVDLVGTTTDILDDTVVDVIVLDTQGGSVTFTAVVQDGRFTVPGADLSSLAEGPITAIATYQDPYGNRVSGTDDSIKDTLASGVDVEAATGSDDVVNAVEAVDNTLSGTFADVQAGAEVEVTVSGAGHADLVFTTTLDASGNWSIPDVDLDVFDDGTLTLTASTVDQAGNPASITDTVEMDTQAAITAEFVDAVQPDGVGGYLNAAEGQMASFTGTVTEVEDGQTVTLVITDEGGNSLTFTTQVSGGVWQLDGQDLSSLAPGELTLDASVEDAAGNPATATDTIVYDPIAEISRPITSDVGRILNAAEVADVDFNGRINDIEPGRELDIVIEDASGNSASGSATVQPDGSWSLTGVDVTGLDEGLLTLSVTGTDLAGNEATLETFYFKDTLNDLTAEFVDEQTPEGVGGYYNADEASDGVTLQGSANFISDGLPVDVQVRDILGNVVVVSGVTISGSTWQADNVDLSGLEPGQIFVLASTTDFAGNPAFGVDSFIYDPIAIINDDVTSPAFSVPVVNDNTVNAAEVSAGVDFSGTVTDIEAGRTLDVLIEDGAGGSVTDTVTIAADGSWSLTGADLSSLQDGPLTLTLTGTDIAGNEASQTASFLKDTLATGISITADTGADAVLNNDESPNTVLSGSFEFVQEGAVVDITVSDGVNPDLTFQATLDAGGNWTVPDVDLSGLNDGDLTLTADTVDQAGNPASITDTVLKDTSAAITALYDDPQQPEGITGYLNAVEGQSASFGGTVTGIEDGQTVAITITDINDDTLTFSATVTGGAWQVGGANLSSLAQGALVLSVVATDVAGNEATASDTIEYDPVAELVADIAADAGTSINAAEVTDVDFTGSVFDVESGRDVAISIEDGSGNTVTGTATIAADGTWLLADLDLSGLDEGTLTLTADTTDEAGNPATQTATFIKDTQADITAEFVDEQVPDGVGGYYNASEFPAVTLQGTAPLVEDGQTVTVTVEDEFGNVVNVPGVTVNGEAWSAPDVDLSSLQQGNITLTATVTDQAGNTATATDTFIYDPVAIINDDITSPAFSAPQPGDDTVNAAEVAAGVELSGTVTDIESGRVLDIVIEDELGGTYTDTVTIAADGSWTLSGADLSGLDDGTLTVTLTGTDIAGNDATQSATFLKDTLATGISITADTGADAVLNNAESPDTTLSGSFENVQEGAVVDITVSDGVNPDLTFQATLDAAGNWTVPDVDLSGLEDGDLTLTADTVDQAGNPASITDTVLKDTQAAITAEFVDAVQPDGVGGYLNAAEGQSAGFTGTVTGVEDGQLVTVTVTDVDGNALVFSTNASGGTWEIEDEDLSSLTAGELTLDATVEDAAGNLASATDTIIYDPVAAIPPPITSDGGRILNAAEVGAVTFSGRVNDVEPGRDIEITITDNTGAAITETVQIDAAGDWTLTDVDVSGLAEGLLSFSVTTTDIAGNTAVRDTFFYKDTLNELTAEFVDQQTPDGVEGYYNAAEVANLVTLRGTANFIFDGETVSLSVRDSEGNEVTVPGVPISGGQWQADNVDLSSLVPGEIVLIANTTDDAGNPAFAADTFIYDPIADIPPPITSNGGRILNAAEVGSVDFDGRVEDVEPGRDITITLTDSAGASLTETVQINADGTWSLTGVDVSGMAEGILTFSVTTTDIAGNTAVRETLFFKDTINELTAEFVDQQTPDGVGGYYNADEVSNLVTLQGTAVSIADGEPVTVTVRDSEGNEVSVPGVTISGGQWQADNVDLSSLVPGVITLTAESVDLAGNPAFAADTFIYDPIAQINDDIDGPGLDDDTFNAVEIAAGSTLTGTVTDIESGRVLDIVIEDELGGSYTDTVTIAADGSWTLSDADLSALEDGTLTVTLTGTDIAGNDATRTDSFLKDTLATGISITADTGADAVLNNDESPDTSLSGSFEFVQEGALVDITVNDGVNPALTFQATLDASGNWTVPDVDLSGLNDGDLTLYAETVDQAGNPASITDTVLKDTSAEITALYDDPQQPEGIAGYLNAVEG